MRFLGYFVNFYGCFVLVYWYVVGMLEFFLVYGVGKVW